MTTVIPDNATDWELAIYGYRGDAVPYFLVRFMLDNWERDLDRLETELAQCHNTVVDAVTTYSDSTS